MRGYLGLGSNEGDRLGALRAARDELGARGVEVVGVVVGLRDRAAGRGARPARLPQRLPRDRDRAGPGGAARRLQGRRARARPRRRRPAPRAAPDRRRPAAARRPRAPLRAADAAAPRGRPRGASCSSRCWSSTPRLAAARRHAARRELPAVTGQPVRRAGTFCTDPPDGGMRPGAWGIHGSRAILAAWRSPRQPTSAATTRRAWSRRRSPAASACPARSTGRCASTTGTTRSSAVAAHAATSASCR